VYVFLISFDTDSVYKKKQAKRIAELQLEFEELARQQLESLGKNKS